MDRAEAMQMTVREVLSDGGFHSHRDLFGRVAVQMQERPRWQDVAQAAHSVGVEAGYVLKVKP